MSKQRMMKGADVLAGGVSFIGQFLKVSRGLAGVAALAAAAVPAAAEYRFAEGFNELTLGPSVSPTEFNGFGPAAWTPTPPTGWTLDNSGMPQTGVAPEEFYGFTFLNKDFWVQTAGNQERDTFARGRGVVMVADSDEFDDGTDVDGADPNFNLFNTFITTPEIDLTGVGANQALLNFDSSFRPFPDMTGRVEVSYDGGTTFSEVLLLQTDENTFPASSLDRANEHVSISLNNPANGSVQARFSMVDAGNDWWWAVDNVSVTVGGEARVEVDQVLDEIKIINDTDGTIEVLGYQFDSPSGGLDDSAWTPIGGSFATVADTPESQAEVSLSPVTIASGQELSFGVGSWSGLEEDLVADLILVNGKTIGVSVDFTILSDLDQDGDLDPDDWLIYIAGLGADLSGMTEQQAYLMGDLNKDGFNNHADFLLFKEEYNTLNGEGALEAAIATIPEPTTTVLLGLGGLALLRRRR